MIRLDKKMAEEVLILLTMAKSTWGNTIRWGTAVSGDDITDYHTRVARNDLVFLKDDDVDTVDDIIETMKQQLTNDNNGKDMSLIDVMVRLLGLSYGVNKFSPVVLNKLRTAILRPDEVANFQQSIMESMTCSKCNRTLSNQEEATITINVQSGLQLFCIACMQPQMFNCIKCNQSMPTSLNQQKRLLKANVCEVCKRAKKDVVVDAVSGVAVDDPATPSGGGRTTIVGGRLDPVVRLQGNANVIDAINTVRFTPVQNPPGAVVTTTVTNLGVVENATPTLTETGNEN